MIQRTLVLIKPDGVQRGLIGQIITRFENAGLKIIGMKLVQADKELSKKHYIEHYGKDFYSGLEKYITEGPVVAMVLEGIDAIAVVRKIVGPTEPKSAPPGTIRGDFSHISFDYADKSGKAVKNLIHASGNEEDAEREIKLWFNDDELYDYRTVHEIHTR
ncbi:MAG: nucleoside-diphosphate kinase [Nitrospiraceae bacterium]|nr:nucleoside-diphosphate kinase [Nitrospiraceae bacterium]